MAKTVYSTDTDGNVKKPILSKPELPVQPLPKPNNGDVQIPGQPGVKDVETMSTSATSASGGNTDQEPASNGGYNTINNQIWGEGGSGQQGYQDYLDAEKQTLNQDAVTAMTDEEYNAWLKQLGIDSSMYEKGGYNQAGNGTQTNLPGTGEEGWYYTEGGKRPVQAGTSGADEDLLSEGGYALIQGFQAEWDRLNELAKEAKASGNLELANQYIAQRDLMNVYANQIRAGAGYYGGADGSMYVPLAQLGIEQATQELLGTGGGAGGIGSGANGDVGAAANTPEAQIQSLLDQWKATALEQSNGQIDYAVAQAIKELERALEDAQPQFKEQAESISIDERQAMDNSALYAELRGDKGGIGQEQYNSIQNTAAQNRLAVQQAQTKLATDTARLIEDLRAQGEFEKADKALEITQAYLSQLISLEQWAAEFNFSQEQFQASLQQWESEYQMAMQQLQISQEQWREEMNLNKIVSDFEMQLAQNQYQSALEQWQQEFNYNKYMDSLNLQQNAQNQAAQVGYALLEAGRIDQITDAQLSAMGFTREQAQAYYDAMAAQNLTTAQSAAYKDVLAKAKAFETAEEANRYLSQMVAGGYITEQERSYIHSVVLGQDRPLVSETNENWGEGYGTHVGTGSYKGTEWGAVRNTILSNLRAKNFDAVTSYMDQIAGGLSYEQFEELMALFDEYDYSPYSAVN